MSDLSIGLRIGVTMGELESFGHTLIEKFGALNVGTAALLGGALILDRALSRHARASLRIALYAPIALRILLPLDWSLPIANAPRVAALFSPLLIGGPAPTDVPSSHSPSWHAFAAVAYVVVAALLATRAVLARMRLGRALAEARPVSALDGGVPCPILAHEDWGPMVVGFLAPCIVVPRRLLASGEEHALACVLRHETAHVRRGDAWLSVAMQVFIVVAWPVVPLWIAAARVRQLVELACDEAALVGADATERRRYGHALLDIAESRSLAPLGAGELHFGSTLRARIEALASQRHWPLAAQVITLSLAPLALLAACGGAAAPAPPPVAAPSGSAEREDYGYQFETDPAKAAVTPNAPSPTPASTDGRVPPEVIQSTVRAHLRAFKTCYEAGLKRDPRLAGVVSVKFVFGEDGVTKEAFDEHSTLPDKEVVGCVVGEFRKLTYAKAHAGNVTVVYPLEFAP